jgi:acetoin utilization protein AcuB
VNIEEIMSRKVVTVEFDDRLSELREIFANLRFHHLLVVEEGQLYGIISDRDLFKAISPSVGTPGETPRDSATLNKRAHQIMTRKPVTLAPDASVWEAVEIFLERGISCIPVVDGERRPVGILSWRDILRTIMQMRSSRRTSTTTDGVRSVG